MKKTLTFWKVKGFIFVGILGVILHFLYEWTNENRFVACFSAVNESTWEHMKILFFPMLIFSFIEARYNSYEYKNYWWTNLLGTVSGILLIPVLFYTINGAFGKTPDYINILIFFISAYVAYYIELKLIKRNKSGRVSERGSLLLLCIIAVIFVVFTFFTPQIPLFMDPISGMYGI